MQNNHSPRWYRHSIPGSFHWWCHNPQRESPVTDLLLRGEPSQGVSSRGPFYNLVRSELWSFMVSGLEASLSWGTSLAGTQPVDQGVPLFSFPPQGMSIMTRVTVCQRSMVVSTTQGSVHDCCHSRAPEVRRQGCERAGGCHVEKPLVFIRVNAPGRTTFPSAEQTLGVVQGWKVVFSVCVPKTQCGMPIPPAPNWFSSKVPQTSDLLPCFPTAHSKLLHSYQLLSRTQSMLTKSSWFSFHS